MVIFDQLRISDDGQLMFINAHVNTASYFTNVTIESVTITTADKVLETDGDIPSDYLYKQTFEDVTEVALVVTPTSFNEAFNNVNSSGEAIDSSKPVGNVSYSKSSLSGDLFFVYIKCPDDTVVDISTPCTLDETTTLGVVFDETVLYQKVMNYTNELNRGCLIPNGFIDFILLWNAFKASVETEHIIPAIKYYNMLFGTDSDGNAYGPHGNIGTITSSNNCGCNG